MSIFPFFSFRSQDNERESWQKKTIEEGNNAPSVKGDGARVVVQLDAHDSPVFVDVVLGGRERGEREREGKSEFRLFSFPKLSLFKKKKKGTSKNKEIKKPTTHPTSPLKTSES